MTIITIVGAGMMGSALCMPLHDNGHTVRLVGTPLDDHIIASLRSTGYHPTLQRPLPKSVQPFVHSQLAAALAGANLVVCGVSSFGVDWWAETVGPHLRPDVPVLAVTKGMVDEAGGSLTILPDYINRRLPSGLRDRVSFNAIGGPCVSHDLAARFQSCVVFCGREQTTLDTLRHIFATDYYHIWTSTDMAGVEISAALKNAYALAVSLGIGMAEQHGGDGLALMYNPAASLFGQSVYELQRWLQVLGSNAQHAAWLPGAGDMYVTISGGRTVRLGKLLGAGVPMKEALQRLAGVTLESVNIVAHAGRALRRLEERGVIETGALPLLAHLYEIVVEGKPVDVPWDRFFADYQR